MSRFSDLEFAYNSLVAANFNFDSLPVTNPIRKYSEWKQDPEKREIGEGNMPESGTKSAVGVQAFGLPATDDEDKVIIKIGSRAKTLLSGLADAVKFGVETTTLTTYASLGGFVPAKAILATKVAATTKTSDITGRKYRNTTGTTYTLPMGKNGTVTREIKAQDAILATSALVTAYSISFKPERLRRR